MVIPKRILILTADIGFGHRNAAQAIAAALQETHGKECHISVVNPLDDRRVWHGLRNSQTNYDRIVRKMPTLYNLGYQASDAHVPCKILQWALTATLSEVLLQLIWYYSPHVIITTHPFYQAPLRCLLPEHARYTPLITVVTDLSTLHRLWFHQDVDLYLVPSPQAEALALTYGIPAHQVKVTGLPIHPAFAKETRQRQVIRAELGWQPDTKTLLIVGSKRFAGLVNILRALNQSQLPIQLVAVTGGDDYVHHQLLDTEWDLPVHIYKHVSNMPTLMHAANAIICKAGGLIVAESLACGLPIILSSLVPGQEIGNASYVLQGKAGEIAYSPREVVEIVQRWLKADGKLLEQHAANARQLGSTEAAYLVADHIWTIDRPHPHTRNDWGLTGWASLFTRGYRRQAEPRIPHKG